MPIDASSDPYDAGFDPDDLALAGKGAFDTAAAAAVSGKSLGGLDDDDDLESAGKGADPVPAPFEPDPVDKGFEKDFDSGLGDDAVDDPTGGASSAGDLLEDGFDPDDGAFDGKVGAFGELDDADDDPDDLDLDGF